MTAWEELEVAWQGVRDSAELDRGVFAKRKEDRAGAEKEARALLT